MAEEERGRVGGPVPFGWREGALSRAKELEAQCEWVLADHPRENRDPLAKAIPQHLDAAREAAKRVRLDPKQWFYCFCLFRDAALHERAKCNLDAAQANLLSIAPPDYVLGQVPSVLRDVQCHLIPTDPRRREMERIARRLGMTDQDSMTLPNAGSQKVSTSQRRWPGHRRPLGPSARAQQPDDTMRIVEEERTRIVAAQRGASSASLREQVRVRSFRSVIVVTTVLMTVFAATVAIAGWIHPTMIPLCFAPEESGQAVVVCPLRQSERFSTIEGPGTAISLREDIDDFVARTSTPQDLLVVELVGLTAAAVAAAAAIRGLRGSSERHHVPEALALLKLPTGAVTAFLGLLLMRGQFVPGLSALDTSAQILAWALVFGYAQQLFTHLVDRQGQAVLDSVRGANKAQPNPSPP